MYTERPPLQLYTLTSVINLASHPQCSCFVPRLYLNTMHLFHLNRGFLVFSFTSYYAACFLCCWKIQVELTANLTRNCQKCKGICKLWFFSHWVPVYSNCLQLIRFNKHFCSSIILCLNLTFQCTHLRISHNLNNWTVDQHFLSKYENSSLFLYHVFHPLGAYLDLVTMY